MAPDPTVPTVHVLATLVQTQGAGLGLASGLTLLMLSLCFAVGHRLRPHWGLNWLALSMLATATRGLAAATGALTLEWRSTLALMASVGLAALVTGLRNYVGQRRWAPWAEFAVFLALWQAMSWAARTAGLGLSAGVLSSVLIYLYLASLCLPRLRAVAGESHPLAAGAVLFHPLVVVGGGMGLMHLDGLTLHSWSALSYGLLGLGLLMAAAGRLKAELMRELARRQAAEDQLRQLNDSLEQRIATRTEELAGLVDGLESFNRMVSHDLRGPLGGLTGVALLTRQALAERDLTQAERLLAVIETETRRLSTLVSELLLLARVSNADLARCDTPLDEVLAQALQRLTLTEGEQRVAQVQAGPLPHAEVDGPLVQQVFVNLIGNALKFSQGRATPTVRVHEARSQGPQVVVEVSDNGPGFDPAQAAQLFQPFKRLHGREVAGHGIGLSIVRRIVERHGGRVWAEGRPGEGASFFFSLPAVQRPATGAGPGRHGHP